MGKDDQIVADRCLQVQPHVERWACDVCHVATFDTYEEACEHEESCKGVVLSKPVEGTALGNNTTTKKFSIVGDKITTLIPSLLQTKPNGAPTVNGVSANSTPASTNDNVESRTGNDSTTKARADATPTESKMADGTASSENKLEEFSNEVTNKASNVMQGSESAAFALALAAAMGNTDSDDDTELEVSNSSTTKVIERSSAASKHDQEVVDHGQQVVVTPLREAPSVTMKASSFQAPNVLSMMKKQSSKKPKKLPQSDKSRSTVKQVALSATSINDLGTTEKSTQPNENNNSHPESKSKKATKGNDNKMQDELTINKKPDSEKSKGNDAVQSEDVKKKVPDQCPSENGKAEEKRKKRGRPRKDESKQPKEDDVIVLDTNPEPSRKSARKRTNSYKQKTQDEEICHLKTVKGATEASNDDSKKVKSNEKVMGKTDLSSSLSRPGDAKRQKTNSQRNKDKSTHSFFMNKSTKSDTNVTSSKQEDAFRDTSTKQGNSASQKPIPPVAPIFNVKGKKKENCKPETHSKVSDIPMDETKKKSVDACKTKKKDLGAAAGFFANRKQKAKGGGKDSKASSNGTNNVNAGKREMTAGELALMMHEQQFAKFRKKPKPNDVICLTDDGPEGTNMSGKSLGTPKVQERLPLAVLFPLTSHVAAQTPQRDIQAPSADSTAPTITHESLAKLQKSLTIDKIHIPGNKIAESIEDYRGDLDTEPPKEEENVNVLLRKSFLQTFPDVSELRENIHRLEYGNKMNPFDLTQDESINLNQRLANLVCGRSNQDAACNLYKMVHHLKSNQAEILERRRKARLKKERERQQALFHPVAAAAAKSKKKNKKKQCTKNALDDSKDEEYEFESESEEEDDDHFDDEDEWFGSKRRRGNTSNRSSTHATANSSLDDPTLYRVMLLVGPSGCGKTHLVHQIAAVTDCHVLELNTSHPRNGAALKHTMEEATQSQSLSSKLTPTMKNTSTFYKEQKADANQLITLDDDDQPENTAEKARTSKASETSNRMPIILIDEVDLIFDDSGDNISGSTNAGQNSDSLQKEGGGSSNAGTTTGAPDAGFWTALRQLACRTTVPIVLTCNTCPAILRNNVNLIFYKQEIMERPTPQECASYIQRSLSLNGGGTHQQSKDDNNISCSSKDGEIIVKSTLPLAQACTLLHCDLRRIIRELHMYSVVSLKEKPSNLLGSASILEETDENDTKDHTMKDADAGVKHHFETRLGNKIVNDVQFTKTVLNATSQEETYSLPEIYSISPTSIPSETGGTLVVTGKNFCVSSGKDIDDSHRNSHPWKLYIGDKLWEGIVDYEIVNNTTLHIKIPPCLSNSKDMSRWQGKSQSTVRLGNNDSKYLSHRYISVELRLASIPYPNSISFVNATDEDDQSKRPPYPPNSPGSLPLLVKGVTTFSYTFPEPYDDIASSGSTSRGRTDLLEALQVKKRKEKNKGDKSSEHDDSPVHAKEAKELIEEEQAITSTVTKKHRLKRRHRCIQESKLSDEKDFNVESCEDTDKADNVTTREAEKILNGKADTKETDRPHKKRIIVADDEDDERETQQASKTVAEMTEDQEIDKSLKLKRIKKEKCIDQRDDILKANLNREIECLEAMSQCCAYASDAHNIENAQMFALPSLSGSVPGFGGPVGMSKGSGTGRGSSMLRSQATKPLSFEKLFLSDNVIDMAFYHGCQDTYMCRPTSIVDRRQNALMTMRREAASNRLRLGFETSTVGGGGTGGALVSSAGQNNDVTNGSASGVDLDDSVLSVARNHLGACSLQELPSMLRRQSNWSYTKSDGSGKDVVIGSITHRNDAKLNINCIDRQIYAEARECIECSTFLLEGEEGEMECTALQCNFNDNSENEQYLSRAHVGEHLLDSRLALEIYPALRRMAYFENEEEKKQNVKQEEKKKQHSVKADSLASIACNGNKKSDLLEARQTQTRLRTRRRSTQNGDSSSSSCERRDHYFDKHLKPQFYKDQASSLPVEQQKQSGKRVGDLFASKLLKKHETL